MFSLRIHNSPVLTFLQWPRVLLFSSLFGLSFLTSDLFQFSDHFYISFQDIEKVLDPLHSTDKPWGPGMVLKPIYLNPSLIIGNYCFALLSSRGAMLLRHYTECRSSQRGHAIGKEEQILWLWDYPKPVVVFLSLHLAPDPLPSSPSWGGNGAWTRHLNWRIACSSLPV